MKRLVPAMCFVMICSFSWGASQEGSPIEISVERAREIALASDLRLTTEEILFIRETRPVHKIYPLAGDHVDYSFHWEMNGKQIVVFGQGDRYKLDGAKVVRQPSGQRKY